FARLLTEDRVTLGFLDDSWLSASATLTAPTRKMSSVLAEVRGVGETQPARATCDPVTTISAVSLALASVSAGAACCACTGVAPINAANASAAIPCPTRPNAGDACKSR